ncbi:MAG: phosphatidylglycerol lysyltransferase domain-containing protein [Alkalispirochaeta sp.]
MEIPQYPDMAPIDLSMGDVLHPRLSMLPDGVSEYTFAGLYLFRKTYDYHLSVVDGDTLFIRGTKDDREFFMLPCGLPTGDKTVAALLDRFDYLKGLSERHADTSRIRLERLGYEMQEDRNNFDYLYRREDLAHLQGRKFHKKRNHVNAFINNYEYDERALTDSNVDDALGILEAWQRTQEDWADYAAAREALERHAELDLKGYLVYVDGHPAAYTLGEPLMKGRSFVVHFEKALDDYRGIYQFINKAFATILPRHYHWINREQDLGDEGLRQSKMTYRPSGFVKKYRVGRNLPASASTDSKTVDTQDQASA